MEKDFSRRYLSIKPLGNFSKPILPAILYANNSNYWKAEIWIKITFICKEWIKDCGTLYKKFWDTVRLKG